MMNDEWLQAIKTRKPAKKLTQDSFKAIPVGGLGTRAAAVQDTSQDL
jgi:hypothetical protein